MFMSTSTVTPDPLINHASVCKSAYGATLCNQYLCQAAGPIEEKLNADADVFSQFLYSPRQENRGDKKVILSCWSKRTLAL